MLKNSGFTLKNSSNIPKIRFQNLPSDLKILILEFLSLPDLYSIQLVSSDICQILKNSSKIWVKFIFLECLNLQPDEDSIWEFELNRQKLPITESTIDPAIMKDSRNILHTYFLLKQRCKTFFKAFLSSSDIKLLVEGLFNSFTRPNSPLPCLKRDIHIFSTNSVFQNFLTEVHFGIDTRHHMKDKRKTIVESFIRRVKSLIGSDQVRITESSKQVPLHKEKHSKKLSNRCHNDHLSPPNVLRREIINGTERNVIVGQGTVSVEGKQNSDIIKEFYSIFCCLVSNHCKAVCSCLQAIKDSSDLLNEYNRYWQGFVLTTIDLNQILSPFSKFYNQIYSNTKQNPLDAEGFSVWRAMVKIWFDQVFSPVSGRLSEAFYDTFCKIQKNEDSAESQHQSNQKQQSVLMQIVNEYLNNESQDVPDQTTGEPIRLLKKIYQSMCDLSYNEETIFFMNCCPVPSGTPKDLLNHMITKHLYQNYKGLEEVLLADSRKTTLFFEAERKLIEEIFGNEACFQVKQTQLAFLKECLLAHFSEIKSELNTHCQINKGFPDPDNIESGCFFRSFDLDLKKVSKMLDLREDANQKILYKKVLEDTIPKETKKKMVQFSSFIRLMEKLAESLETQLNENQEALREILSTGSHKIDESFEGLFSSNQTSVFKTLRCCKNSNCNRGRELDLLS